MVWVLGELVVHRPGPALLPFVTSMTGYRQAYLPTGAHRGLPSPALTLVIVLRGPLVLSGAVGLSGSEIHHDALVGGLQMRPVLVGQHGVSEGLQLAVTPLGTRALLGVPASALVMRTVNLAELLGRSAEALVDKLRATEGWPARFAALELELLRLARPQASLVPEVAEAWRLITGTAGRLRVERLARGVGWSTRHLGERFRAEAGLTPKQVARVARLDRARRLLTAQITNGSALDLGGLATVSGYCDQAHLSREWRALCGVPPAAWVSTELRFVQDR